MREVDAPDPTLVDPKISSQMSGGSLDSDVGAISAPGSEADEGPVESDEVETRGKQ